jgi:hypothetical protein
LTRLQTETAWAYSAVSDGCSYDTLVGMTKISLLLTLLLGVNFAVNAQNPASTSGQIYVYAEKIAWHFGGIKDTLLLDDKKAVSLGTGEYYKITVEPGRHTLAISGKKQGGVALTLKAGETYYLRLERDVGTVIRVKALTIVPKENADFDLPKLSPGKKEKIYDPRVTAEPFGH